MHASAICFCLTVKKNRFYKKKTKNRIPAGSPWLPLAPSHWCLLPPRYARWDRPPSGLSAIAPLSGVGGRSPCMLGSSIHQLPPSSSAAPPLPLPLQRGFCLSLILVWGSAPHPLPPAGGVAPRPPLGPFRPQTPPRFASVGGKPPHPHGVYGGVFHPRFGAGRFGVCPEPLFFRLPHNKKGRLKPPHLHSVLVYIIHRWLWRRSRP